MIGLTKVSALGFLIPLLLAGGTRPVQTQPEVPLRLTRLALDLGVDYERRTISGTARLTMRNLGNRPVTVIPLILNRLMAVSEASSATGASLPFSQEIKLFRDDSSRQVNAIQITIVPAVAPNDSLTVAVRFGGILVGYTETGSLYIKDRVSREFTIIREDAYAFPVIGVPSWRANRAAPRGPFDFAARVTVPAGEVVAMGGEANPPERRDSLITWSYHSREPVPFLNITIAPYQVREGPGGRVFALPTDTAGARMVEQAIAAAVGRFTQWYGPLRREPHLTVMEIPDGFGSQASLNAGIMQTAAAFQDRSELPQLYHELSHVWNVRDLERPSPRWNEGLASFLEYRMAAELDGWTDWDRIVTWFVQSARRPCAKAGCDSIPFARYGAADLTDRSYSVGMVMFYVLYQVLGAESFDRAYREFFQRYQATGATTADLAEQFRRTAPASERILADWLFTTRWYARMAAGETLTQMIEGYRR